MWENDSKDIFYEVGNTDYSYMHIQYGVSITLRHTVPV